MLGSVQTHLVGSLPFRDAREAMEEALSRLGDTVPFLPDGETGERGNYIDHLGDRLGRNPALSVRQRRFAIRGRNLRTLALRGRAALEISLGEIGYCADWAESLPLFRELRERAGRPDLRYQMGVAPAFSIAMRFFAKPFGVRRALAPVQAAIRAEIAEAIRLDRGALALQLDAAMEQIAVAFAHRAAPPAARRLARTFARQLVTLVEDVPADVPVGVHLCFGNPGNRRVVTPKSSKPVIVFANALAAAWPDDRPLDFLHLPFLDSPNPSYCEPLRELRVPKDTRLIAGLVYEDGHAANVQRLELASAVLGFTPDVATACGMGRRTPDVARTLLDQMRALAALRTRA